MTDCAAPYQTSSMLHFCLASSFADSRLASSFADSPRRCSASLRNNLVSCFCPLRYTTQDRKFIFNLVLFMSWLSRGGFYTSHRPCASWINTPQGIEEAQHKLSEEKNPNFSWCFVAAYYSSGTEIIGQCKEGLLFPNDHLDLVDLHISQWKPSTLKICCRNLLGDDQSLIMELGRTLLVWKLEIGNQSYTGRSLRCSSGSFPRLWWLVLHDLDMEEWDIEEGSMPQLEELRLCKCSKLSSLPKGLLLLPKLSRVDLIAMPPSCYQDGTVARTLENAGRIVFISSNEQELKHLRIPEVNPSLSSLALHGSSC